MGYLFALYIQKCIVSNMTIFILTDMRLRAGCTFILGE